MNEGAKNGRSKLTPTKVKKIREHWQLFGGRHDCLLPGNHHIVSTYKLAKQHRLAQSTIWALVNDRTWKE